mgnify:CR=1 FL=1
MARLKEGERIDDLERNGYRIIQHPEKFCFGMDAVLLTGAVHLAENGAEAVAASDSLEEVRALLEENGNAEIFARSGTEDIGAAEESAAERAGADTLRVYYDDDLNPVPDGTIWVDAGMVRRGI